MFAGAQSGRSFQRRRELSLPADLQHQEILNLFLQEEISNSSNFVPVKNRESLETTDIYNIKKFRSCSQEETSNSSNFVSVKNGEEFQDHTDWQQQGILHLFLREETSNSRNFVSVKNREGLEITDICNIKKFRACSQEETSNSSNFVPVKNGKNFKITQIGNIKEFFTCSFGKRPPIPEMLCL